MLIEIRFVRHVSCKFYDIMGTNICGSEGLQAMDQDSLTFQYTGSPLHFSKQSTGRPFVSA